MSFPEEIKKIRQRSFLTQEDFAVRIKVSFSTVNRWEGGKAKPNLTAMRNVRDFCLANEIDFSNAEEAWLNYKTEAKNSD